jgi:uncharacterized protein YjiK
MVLVGSVAGFSGDLGNGGVLLREGFAAESTHSNSVEVDLQAAVPAGSPPVAEAAPVAQAVPEGVRTATAELVATIDTSSFTVPSPDPSGIVWIGPEQRLLVSDSEVNETPIFAGSNLFSVSLSGALLEHGATTSYSNEPAGLGFDVGGNRLFVSDDDRDKVFEVHPGPDGDFGTGDDVVTSFDTDAFGSTDAEGVEFDPATGDLFIVDELGTTVYRVDSGPNGRFDGVENDDVVTSFDLAALGISGPQGIGLDPVRGILLIVDKPSDRVLEVTKTGRLVRIIDISVADPFLAAGVTLAPGSLVPTETNLYVVDRGTDNTSNPDENDGRIYELRVIAPPGDPFVDDNDSVHEGYINALAVAGITVGCNPPSNTLYCPGDLVTRAQMASFLQRAFDLAPNPTDFFADDDGSVHEGNINSIAAAGITLGCNPPVNDRYCPTEAITRGQMASLLVRALGLDPSSVDSFVDDDGSVHEGNINSIAAAGITLGCNPPVNDRFCPGNSLTRGQMASLLGRALELEPLPVQ